MAKAPERMIVFAGRYVHGSDLDSSFEYPRWTVPPPKGGGAVIEASLGSKDLARPSMLTGMQIIYVVNHKGLSTFGLGRYSDRHSAGSLGENLGQAQNGIQSFCVQCD